MVPWVPWWRRAWWGIVDRVLRPPLYRWDGEAQVYRAAKEGS